MSKVTKTIWYKSVSIQGSDSTLHEALSDALEKRPLAGDRLMGQEGLEQTGINLFQTRGEILFGQFLSFLPGHRQPVMTFDNKTTAFDLATMAAEQSTDGKRREFLDSIGYFGVIDNHLLLVQTKSLTSRDFEEYLNWLLTLSTSCLPQSTVITLDDPSATTARKKAARKNIRGITIGTQLMAVSPVEKDMDKTVGKFELSGGGFDALRNLFGAEIFDKLSLEDSLEEDNIELQLTVRVKGRRVASNEGQKVLRAIGRATRHMDPRDYSLELERNGDLKGEDLKLHRLVSVKTNQDGGLVDEISMIDSMVKWLAELNQKGFIES